MLRLLNTCQYCIMAYIEVDVLRLRNIDYCPVSDDTIG